jgi:hypothetical protein
LWCVIRPHIKSEIREDLKLEEHLTTETKPSLEWTGNAEKLEKDYEDLMDKYPLPERYSAFSSTRPSSQQAAEDGAEQNAGNENNTHSGSSNKQPVLKFPKSVS